MRYVQGDVRASHLVSLLCYITESDKTSKFISYKNAAYFSKPHLSLPTVFRENVDDNFHFET